GLGDPYRRLERYLARLCDGGPVLLPDGGAQPTRHVYAPDVARTIAALLGDARAFGQAYNLAQDETPSLAEIVRQLAGILGAPDRTVAVSRAALEAAGLEPATMSPFSGRWMSFLEPRRAEEELGFVHTPLAQYLETIAHAYLAAPPGTPPPGYELRAMELALAGG
ncbi:MAG TPA: epimerase, partial [Polyangiaceae bacterium]